MAWSILKFGKHKGKSLPQVLFTDPDWFFYMYDKKKAFQESPEQLRREADIIYAKASSIKIPQRGSEPLQVEYNFYYEDHTSAGFDLVPTSQPRHEGSTPTERADYIDMRIPRQQKHYDKLGYRLFLRSLKFHLFGNEFARMTRKKCEEFFDDNNNFHRNA